MTGEVARMVHPDGSATVPLPRDPDQISLLRVVTALLRHRGLVVGTVFACLLIGAAVVFVPRRTYLVAASFVPQTRKSATSLSGLAEQFGFTIPSLDAQESPQFYLELLKSRAILGPLVETVYTAQTDTGVAKGNLMELYRTKGKTPGRRREAILKQLDKDITATVNLKTSVVDLEVTARYPDLALQMAQRLLALVSQFNMENRQSQASAERKFTERRLGEVEAEFREAEGRLQEFLQRNRDYRNSPELTFQFERLDRDVNLKYQVYRTLAQAYEQAKIEEVRDTPVLTLVDPPELPVRPRSRDGLKIGLLSLFLGLGLGITFAVSKDLLAGSTGQRQVELQELAALRRAALDDLLHPWRLLGRWVRAIS